MNKLVFLDRGTLGADADLSPLEHFGTLTCYEHTRPEDVVDRVGEADVVISNKVVLDHDILAQLPNLKLICVAATGTNNIDLETCRSRGIAVTNVAGYSTSSVAQHTFALLFSLLENLPYYLEYTRSGAYLDSPFFTHLDHSFYELAGKRWGIIGLGSIGTTVARLAEAFGCEVVYFSASGLNHNADYRQIQLPEMMETCDIISIHAPLNPQTQDLIDYAHITLMKPEAILINMGRGGIVNEADVAQALNEKLIRGYATDVLGTEPMTRDCPLLTVTDPSRLAVTPHIAWGSREARTRLVEELQKNITSFLAGQRRSRLD